MWRLQCKMMKGSDSDELNLGAIRLLVLKDCRLIEKEKNRRKKAGGRHCSYYL